MELPRQQQQQPPRTYLSEKPTKTQTSTPPKTPSPFQQHRLSSEYPFPNGTPSPKTQSRNNGSAVKPSPSRVPRGSDLQVSPTSADPNIPAINGGDGSLDSPGHPAGPKNVSFASATAAQDAREVPPTTTTNASPDPARPSKPSRVASKIRSLALPLASTSATPTAPGHTKSYSVPVAGEAILNRISEQGVNGEGQHGQDRRLGLGIDAANISPTATPKQQQQFAKLRRKSADISRTAPNTPRYQSFRDFISVSTRSPQQNDNRPRPVRSSTMIDLPGDSALISEEEARERRRRDWKRRGSDWMQNHLRQTSSDAADLNETSGDPRPSNFRRITGLAGPEGGPSIWKVRSEAGAQRWRQLKAGLRIMGQKRREEIRIDQLKSAELMAELLAGSPAALILASSFQRDESRKKKIPVLLEQLKIAVIDSQRREDSAGDRHVVFRIELEYGSGLMRMKWTINRSLRDFVNLHVKYKLQSKKKPYIQAVKTESNVKAKMPRFPKSAFPYLRGVRGLIDDDEEDDANPDDEPDPDGLRRPAKLQHNQQPLFAQVRPQSSQSGPDVLNPPSPINALSGFADPSNNDASKKDAYADRQRRKLEVYLRELIRFTIFRAGSNRLCRFLELSALGIKLAAEGGYHGKEGALSIQSGKGVDFRRAVTPLLFYERHKPKWFLVRHSYIVCVDSPEDMNVYDVFLVDGDFQVQAKRPRLRDQKSTKDFARTAKNSAAHPSSHILRMSNGERKMRLIAKNERQLNQFEDSIHYMTERTEWSQKHRFDSFAPVRHNVFAQWLVDGRDYMWNVSRAINMAQDVIYIHDWWLSPELYMRRPAAISHKWRLDRLLKRKAEQGVKIFVIMYRNINSAIPIDSEYSKFSLLDLHPNIFVQRSPNQVRQNVFFWAHHEKICVVDHTVAFCGGVDLCFGRWDTPQHLLVDDKATGFEPGNGPKDADHCQLWPGKDYSNPRVLDFFKLDDPYGEMYDRTKVPRMPWHDIGMQIVGQPARDLTRHFVQRWNYILRQRRPSRPTPFLLPPPDFDPADLAAMNLEGTCDIQILRSACDWSIGTPNRTECSIMNAYIKLIQTSEHFVYIENQFFISSCTVDGNRMDNKIGDALVERIIRAHDHDEDWRCVIIIPLMPGFQNTVDAQDGTSVRLIMQCQYRSICRGETSIFERLRSAGINPEDYIQFYSLRSWGKIGPNKALVTEQLYIHAKCMVVDDRYAIIGSANINERSMLGDRDSEIAAVIWDKDMIDSEMAGKPYRVGRFPYTLRLRLMREHLGLDTDGIMHEEKVQREEQEAMEPSEDEEWAKNLSDDFNGGDNLSSASEELDSPTTRRKDHREEFLARSENVHTFNHDADWLQAENPHLLRHKKVTHDSRVTNNEHHELDIDGYGVDHMAAFENTAAFIGRDSVVGSNNREFLVNDVAPERGYEETGDLTPGGKENHKLASNAASKRYPSKGKKSEASLPPWRLERMDTEDLGLTQLSQLPALPVSDDTDIGGPPLTRSFSNISLDTLRPLLAEMRRPLVDKNCMQDPLADSFYVDTWHTIADNNTKLFRQVFRCMPDSQVTDWKEYEAFNTYNERFAQSQGVQDNSESVTGKSNESAEKSGPLESGSVAGSDTASQRNGSPREGRPLSGVSSGALRPEQSLLRKISSTFSQRKLSVRSNRSNGSRRGNHENEKAGLGDANISHDHDLVNDERLTVPSNPFPPGLSSGVSTTAELNAYIGSPLQNALGLSKDDNDIVDEKKYMLSEKRTAPKENHPLSNQTSNPLSMPPRTVDFGVLPIPNSTMNANGTTDELNSIPGPSTGVGAGAGTGSQRRRRRATTKSSAALRPTDPLLSKGDAEALMKLVQGHLVLWPYDWLLQEERGGKWLYSVDQMAPLEIYD